MQTELSRRSFITRSTLASGGMALVAIGCGADGSTPSNTDPTATPKASDFPYGKFIPAGYLITASEKSTITEAAYHAYWQGGCCHAVYSTIMGQFATTVGAPFDQLPLDMGIFGGGGIAGFGSICGTVLGGVLAINNIVADSKARAAMMTDLLRWYEGSMFPEYVPAAIDAKEVGKTTLDFSAGNMATLQVTPDSHLCHASRSKWCVKNGVAATSTDVAARCGRVSADVAGKVVDQINTYLAGNQSYTGVVALDAQSTSCLGCHPASSAVKPAATGMRCDSCHTDKVTNHP